MAFRYLVADEVRRNLRAPWLLVGVVILSVGGWSAIRLGQRDWAEQRDAFAELVQGRLQAQLTSPAATGRAAETGLRVVRPPNLGVVLLQGDDRSLPSAWEFAPAGAEALSPFSTGSRLPGGGSWDLEILARMVGGLLAIGLGLWNPLLDRRANWHEALRGLPVSPQTVSTARVIAGSATLFVVVLSWWLVMSMAVWWHGPGSVLLPRLWLLAPASLLSLLSAFGLAVVCATAIRNEFIAIVTCIALWAGIGVLGPTAIALIAEFALPTAPQARMERERGQQYRGHATIHERHRCETARRADSSQPYAASTG